MKHKKLPLYLIFFLLIIGLPTSIANAASLEPEDYSLPVDVGNFNDYDSSNYDSDYDYNDYDYSSGSSWYEYDNDSESHSSSWGSSNSEHSSLGGPSVEFLSGGAAIIVVIIVLAFAFAKSKKETEDEAPPVHDSGYIAPYPPRVKDNTEAILPILTSNDPHFDNLRFIAWAKDLFVTIQAAWMEREWGKLRSFETDTLYQQHETQLKEYVELGYIPVIEDIRIDQAYLQEYILESEYEYLAVFLDVHMIDYIKEIKSENVLKGSKQNACHRRYLYTFMRKRGLQTQSDNSYNLNVCPHCGAPIQVNISGQCKCCNQIITTGLFDWLLSDIRVLGRNESVFNSGIRMR